MAVHGRLCLMSAIDPKQTLVEVRTNCRFLSKAIRALGGKPKLPLRVKEPTLLADLAPTEEITRSVWRPWNAPCRFQFSTAKVRRQDDQKWEPTLTRASLTRRMDQLTAKRDHATRISGWVKSDFSRATSLSKASSS